MTVVDLDAVQISEAYQLADRLESVLDLASQKEHISRLLSQ